VKGFRFHRVITGYTRIDGAKKTHKKCLEINQIPFGNSIDDYYRLSRVFDLVLICFSFLILEESGISNKVSDITIASQVVCNVILKSITDLICFL